MKKFARTVAIFLLATSFSVGIGKAFYDEVLALKNELKVYEMAHASDFSDIINELDGIIGSVFSDVSEGDWFQPYVTSLGEWNIVSGYKDASGKSTGKFMPEKRVTIAEVLKMTLKAARVDERLCNGTPILQSAVGHWSQIYVACGERLGVRVLRASNTDINRAATRAEVVTIVHDIFGDKVPALVSPFSDTAGHQYESDIGFAAIAKMVSGDAKGKGGKLAFRPNDPIVRAETAKIIYERIKLEARKKLAGLGSPSL